MYACKQMQLRDTFFYVFSFCVFVVFVVVFFFSSFFLVIMSSSRYVDNNDIARNTRVKDRLIVRLSICQCIDMTVTNVWLKIITNTQTQYTYIR